MLAALILSAFQLSINVHPTLGLGESYFKMVIRSGQVWEHAPEQRVAASTFYGYSSGLRLAITQADAWPILISLRC